MCHRFLLCALLLLSFLSAASGQNRSVRPLSPDPKPESDHFIVDVDVVDVFFNVRGNDHQLLPGLPEDEFQLYENGRPQRIQYFSQMAEQPLRIALMIDSSGSQTRVLEQEKQVAGSFLEQVLRHEDEALIVSFDSGIELQHDFTNSAEELRAALAKIQRVSSENSRGLGAITQPWMRSTALYDAIHLTAEHRMDGRNGRKVFIIITDGEDQGSKTEASHAIEDAIRANAMCYVLLVADSAVSNREKYVGEKRMAELAQRTGGRLIRVGRRLKDLPKHFNEISTELRNQYSIGYTPEDRGGSGEYRKIMIRSRRGYQVQSRLGYFARFGKKQQSNP